MNSSVLTSSGVAPSGAGTKSFSNVPQSGSSSVRPLIGAKRSRGFGVDQALFNPSATTRVVSHYSNPSLNYKVFAQAFSEGWQTGFKSHMPMFIHLDDKSSNHNFRVLASVQLLNYYLAIASADPNWRRNYLSRKTMKKSLIPEAPNDDGSMSPNAAEDKKRERDFLRDFLSKWSFFGVINNDMDLKSNLQKLFNCTVRGRCRVFNIWDSGIQQGSRLFLNLVLVPWDPHTHYIAPDSSRMSSIPPNDYWTPSNSKTKHVWQLVGITHRELSGDSGHVSGHFDCGTVINSVARKADGYYRDRAYRDHQQMVQLPSIEVALHIAA